ncbi:transcription factor subunit Med10 of mediator complex-domain-containing protein [Cubamyces menziesii]|nr:transcription factor subunit Med10 of mediator complex-domain-containing protein [Cubamyces menziesii]
MSAPPPPPPQQQQPQQHRPQTPSTAYPAAPAPVPTTPIGPVSGGIPAAPDSPREAETPPPPGIQGDLEMELMGLANALYNLGTTVVGDLTKEKDKPGGAGKQVGARVNDVISHLATLDDMSQHLETMIPMQVLIDIDNSRNPMLLTKERLERAATENQFMNGKIQAIDSYKKYLDEALMQNFPELREYLMDGKLGDYGQPIKVEEDGGGLNGGAPNGV